MSVNTMLFSTIKGLLFADVTAADPSRLVLVSMGGANVTSYPNLLDLRRSGILAGVAGAKLAFLSARTGEEAQRTLGEVVTANYFDVLGVHAAFGRTFSPDEGQPARNPRVAVLSYGYWRRAYGGDPGVFGRGLSIYGQSFTVVGVLPQDYRSLIGFGFAPDMYVLLGPAGGSKRAHPQ